MEQKLIHEFIGFQPADGFRLVDDSIFKKGQGLIYVVVGHRAEYGIMAMRETSVMSVGHNKVEPVIAGAGELKNIQFPA